MGADRSALPLDIHLRPGQLRQPHMEPGVPGRLLELPADEVTLGVADGSKRGPTGPLLHSEAGAIEGRSPWYLAYRRLRRNRVALAFGALFVLIVIFCLAAPLWADHVAHTGPDQQHLSEKITIDGKPTDVVSCAA